MSTKRNIHAAQSLLMFPALLFMGALLVRDLAPSYSVAAATAGLVVNWYAQGLWTLWVLLSLLPMAALVMGGVTLYCNAAMGTESGSPLQRWLARADGATQSVAAITLTAAIVLSVVGAHVAAN